MAPSKARSQGAGSEQSESLTGQYALRPVAPKVDFQLTLSGRPL